LQVCQKIIGYAVITVEFVVCCPNCTIAVSVLWDAVHIEQFRIIRDSGRIVLPELALRRVLFQFGA
jgi:hypothetical protein